MPCPCPTRLTLPEGCRCTSSVDKGSWSRTSLQFSLSHSSLSRAASCYLLLILPFFRSLDTLDLTLAVNPPGYIHIRPLCYSPPLGFPSLAQLRHIQTLQPCSTLQTLHGARLRWSTPSPSMVCSIPYPWSTSKMTSHGTTLAMLRLQRHRLFHLALVGAPRPQK